MNPAAGGDWGMRWLLGVPFRTGMPPAKMAALQDRRLAWLVRHAARTMPFYRDLLRSHGTDAEDIRGGGDLPRLPVVSRDAMREAGERAWDSGLAHERRLLISTSGSSDMPLTLAFRRSDRLRKHVVGLHCMWMYGWRPWHRGMALGSQALPRNHGLERFGISRWLWVDPSTPVRDWLEAYHQLRPQAFHSYPSALREFCLEVLGHRPLEWLPRVFSVGGELPPPDLDALATEVFGRPPRNMYGAVEGGRLAFSCGVGRGLHVRPDAALLEILGDKGPAEPGERGRVVLTSLVNTASPIIRYELGDLAAWEPGSCSCGLWWPRIIMYEGRSGDSIGLTGGRNVPVTSLASIVGKSRAVRQFQFVRAADDLLLLRYEPNATVDTSLEDIRESLGRMLPGIEVRLQPWGPLPRTRTGKVKRYVDERKGPACDGGRTA
ncbi:MAG: hypothetical protein PVG42_13615 [Lysobacterales bacterium]